MTEGLKVPNSASDRAQVLANLIELHLTWDVEHLKHCIDPSPAVNSFLEFAALYIPQLQGVAIAEFVGGEETVQVRNEIAVTVMRLVSWIVEQTVMLAEAVAPHYLSYHAVGLHEEGKRALWDLDACLAAACQQKMQADADVINIGYLGVVPPLYSRPVLDWAFKQLMWIETMAGRLETKVDQVPNHYGEKVQLFCLTKEALRYHLFQGQNHLKAAEGAPQAEAARAAQAYQARY